MKSIEFSRILDSSCDMIERCHGHAASLKALAGLLRFAGSMTVKALVDRMSVFAATHPYPKPAELTEQLELVCSVLSTCRAKPALEDGQRILGFLSNAPTTTGSTDEFSVVSMQCLTSLSSSSRPGKNAKGSIDAATIQAIIEELESRRLSGQGFSHIVELIIKDRRLTQANLQDIASRFLGYSRKIKSKKEFAEVLRSRQI